jgi:hypothetical protein
MHIPVRIRITCSLANVARIREYLQLNRLIYVISLNQLTSEDPNSAVLDVTGTVFDYEDIPILEGSLMRFGTFNSNQRLQLQQHDPHRFTKGYTITNRIQTGVSSYSEK